MLRGSSSGPWHDAKPAASFVLDPVLDKPGTRARVSSAGRRNPPGAHRVRSNREIVLALSLSNP